MSDVKFGEQAGELPISRSAIAGDFLYTIGFGEDLDPWDPKPGMRKVFDELKRELDRAGLDWPDVAKVTAVLSRVEDFKPYNEVYREYFKAPFPVRTTTRMVTELPLLEIDLVAYRKGLSDRR